MGEETTTNAPVMGKVGWLDLTVPNAPEVRDFYERVVGLSVEACPMGGYDDYVMKDAAGAPAAGICHSRGPNADLPPVWLPYFQVPDLDAAVQATLEAGGNVVRPSQGAGGGRFAVVRDPAGAFAALYQPAK